MYEVWLAKENLLAGRLRGREEEKKNEEHRAYFLCASSLQRERRKRDVCVCVCGTGEFLPLL